MPTYAIGDVQGCLNSLKKLLAKINYHPQQDVLWFAGDLVNRGPHSLQTLRFIRQLEGKIVSVLGNHDLALLAIASHAVKMNPHDTFSEILNAEDKESLLHWLSNLPLLHHDATLGFTLTHAGIFPEWDLPQAQSLAQEAEAVLRSKEADTFFHYMYGDTPVKWESSLIGWDRIRFIVNAFTRMRFLTPTGELDLSAKGPLSQHLDLVPWFKAPHRKTIANKILFGHWAALGGKCDSPNVYPLDTGCAWGKSLTAICLESMQLYSVDCKNSQVR